MAGRGGFRGAWAERNQFRVKWFGFRVGCGWRGLGIGRFGGRFPRTCVGFGGAFGSNVEELFECELVVALGPIDAAADAFEGFLRFEKSGAEGGFSRFEEFVLPDGGIDGCVAAQQPFRADEHVDEGAVFRDGGLVAVVEGGDEGFVIGPGFEAQDFGFGVEAGF